MIEWSVKHKSILALLTTIVIIFGTISYIGMEREENPAISSPVALIKSIYPGTSPDRKSTRLNSSHVNLVCRLLLEKKKK